MAWSSTIRNGLVCILLLMVLVSDCQIVVQQAIASSVTVNNPSGPGGELKAACINGADYIRTPIGQKRIDQLTIGDQVAVQKLGNNFIFEPILTFLHRDISRNAEGLRFVTSNNFNLSLSDEHLIFLAPGRKAVLAKNVRIGDIFHGIDRDESKLEKVIKIERIILQGRYSPLTESGLILVNDILVSCYSQIEDHDLMHFIIHWLLPLTKPDIIFGSEGMLNGGDGLHAIGNLLWHFFRHYFLYSS